MGKSKGYLFGILAAACWGGGTVMSKGSLERFHPILLLNIQLAASVVALWLLVMARRLQRPACRQVYRFAWLGLLEPFLAYLLMLYGLQSVSAGEAVLIQSLESIMIIGVGAIAYRTRPTPTLVLVTLAALLGVYLSIGWQASPASNGSPWGAALIALGTLLAALYVVLSARYALATDAVYMVVCQQSVALLFALLMLPLVHDAFTLGMDGQIPFGVWCLAVVSGLIQYACAFTFYTLALKTLQANTAGVLLGLIPVFGTAGGWLFLHEAVSLQQLAGVLLVAGSIVWLGLVGD